MEWTDEDIEEGFSVGSEEEEVEYESEEDEDVEMSTLLLEEMMDNAVYHKDKDAVKQLNDLIAQRSSKLIERFNKDREETLDLLSVIIQDGLDDTINDIVRDYTTIHHLSIRRTDVLERLCVVADESDETMAVRENITEVDKLIKVHLKRYKPFVPTPVSTAEGRKKAREDAKKNPLLEEDYNVTTTLKTADRASRLIALKGLLREIRNIKWDDVFITPKAQDRLRLGIFPTILKQQEHTDPQSRKSIARIKDYTYINRDDIAKMSHLLTDEEVSTILNLVYNSKRCSNSTIIEIVQQIRYLISRFRNISINTVLRGNKYSEEKQKILKANEYYRGSTKWHNKNIDINVFNSKAFHAVGSSLSDETLEVILQFFRELSERERRIVEHKTSSNILAKIKSSIAFDVKLFKSFRFTKFEFVKLYCKVRYLIRAYYKTKIIQSATLLNTPVILSRLFTPKSLKTEDKVSTRQFIAKFIHECTEEDLLIRLPDALRLKSFVINDVSYILGLGSTVFDKIKLLLKSYLLNNITRITPEMLATQVVDENSIRLFLSQDILHIGEIMFNLIKKVGKFAKWQHRIQDVYLALIIRPDNIVKVNKEFLLEVKLPSRIIEKDIEDLFRRLNDKDLFSRVIIYRLPANILDVCRRLVESCKDDITIDDLLKNNDRSMITKESINNFLKLSSLDLVPRLVNIVESAARVHRCNIYSLCTLRDKLYKHYNKVLSYYEPTYSGEELYDQDDDIVFQKMQALITQIDPLSTSRITERLKLEYKKLLLQQASQLTVNSLYNYSEDSDDYGDNQDYLDESLTDDAIDDYFRETDIGEINTTIDRLFKPTVERVRLDKPSVVLTATETFRLMKRDRTRRSKSMMVNKAMKERMIGYLNQHKKEVTIRSLSSLFPDDEVSYITRGGNEADYMITDGHILQLHIKSYNKDTRTIFNYAFDNAMRSIGQSDIRADMIYRTLYDETIEDSQKIKDWQHETLKGMLYFYAYTSTRIDGKRLTRKYIDDLLIRGHDTEQILLLLDALEMSSLKSFDSIRNAINGIDALMRPLIISLEQEELLIKDEVYDNGSEILQGFIDDINDNVSDPLLILLQGIYQTEIRYKYSWTSSSIVDSLTNRVHKFITTTDPIFPKSYTRKFPISDVRSDHIPDNVRERIIRDIFEQKWILRERSEPSELDIYGLLAAHISSMSIREVSSVNVINLLNSSKSILEKTEVESVHTNKSQLHFISNAIGNNTFFVALLFMIHKYHIPLTWFRWFITKNSNSLPSFISDDNLTTLTKVSPEVWISSRPMVNYSSIQRYINDNMKFIATDNCVDWKGTLPSLPKVSRIPLFEDMSFRVVGDHLVFLNKKRSFWGERIRKYTLSTDEPLAKRRTISEYRLPLKNPHKITSKESIILEHLSKDYVDTQPFTSYCVFVSVDIDVIYLTLNDGSVYNLFTQSHIEQITDFCVSYSKWKEYTIILDKDGICCVSNNNKNFAYSKVVSITHYGRILYMRGTNNILLHLGVNEITTSNIQHINDCYTDYNNVYVKVIAKGGYQTFHIFDSEGVERVVKFGYYSFIRGRIYGDDFYHFFEYGSSEPDHLQYKGYFDLSGNFFNLSQSVGTEYSSNSLSKNTVNIKSDKDGVYIDRKSNTFYCMTKSNIVFSYMHQDAMYCIINS